MTTNFTQNPSGGLRKIEELSASEREELSRYSPAFRTYISQTHDTPQTYADALRKYRNTEWCRAVAATYFQEKPTHIICTFWSHVADEVIRLAWSHCQLDKEPIGVFAMGKLGANELNLSSDVDLILVQTGAAQREAESKVRNFVTLLQGRTEFGFCFRVDLDLRPGGRFAALLPSFSAVEDHYWSRGETWERLALIRARPICGDPRLIQDISELFQRFVFRKFIDFSLLQDLEGLRSKIFETYRATDPKKFDLKRSPGAIRDIELFVHSLLVIHGGKNKRLRTGSTTEALGLLQSEQIYDTNDLQFLSDLYWKLRHIENSIQAKDDRQTHEISVDQLGLALPSFPSDLDRSSEIVSQVIGHVRKQEAFPLDPSAQGAFLSDLGFKTSDDLQAWSEILQVTARSSRLQHDEEARRRCLLLFAKEIAKGLDPSLGLKYLIDFLKSIRAKSSFFSLLLHAPGLIRDLSNLFSCSPYLAQVFINRPELLDSFVFNKSDGLTNPLTSPWDEFLENLVEEKLLAQTRYAMQLLENQNIQYLEAGMTELADRVIQQILDRLVSEFQSASLHVLRLGKWAGAELGIGSDLDFFLLTEDSPTEKEIRVVRRLVSRLTEAHKGGALFQVDLRLRPSGSAGPLVLQKQAFLSYLKESAPAWERQSYFRSRTEPMFDSTVRQLIADRGFSSEDLLELQKIRDDLHHQNQAHNPIKYSPGGLVDCEFAAQIACIQNNVIQSANTVTMWEALAEALPDLRAQSQELVKNYSFLRRVEQLGVLLQKKDDAVNVAKLLGLSSEELRAVTLKTLEENRRILKDLDPIRASV